MEKSWNCVSEFPWEPCINQVIFIGPVTGYRSAVLTQGFETEDS